MIVLVLDAGSSTLKFRIIATDLEAIERDADLRLAGGVVDRIGKDSRAGFEVAGRSMKWARVVAVDHREAVDLVLAWIQGPYSRIPGLHGTADIDAVGHRVVHGGTLFSQSVRLDGAVIAEIEQCAELAPLHNPANLRGIHATSELLGDVVPQVAVFDTAFHATMPEVAYRYPVPHSWLEQFQVRRFGFHGTSHAFVAERYQRLADVSQDAVRIVTLHLGSGSSSCAIAAGRSVNTSMGFTPLAGLMMGTRAGDIDPAVVSWLVDRMGRTPAEVERALNQESGLLGVSGVSSDMRELLLAEASNPRAKLAVDMYCDRVRSRIGSHYVEVGGADALVFTGGIGENAAAIRERVCTGLGCLGLELDQERNEACVRGAAGPIHRDGSRLQAWVIPTDEELMIARETVRLLCR